MKKINVFIYLILVYLFNVSFVSDSKGAFDFNKAYNLVNNYIANIGLSFNENSPEIIIEDFIALFRDDDNLHFDDIYPEKDLIRVGAYYTEIKKTRKFVSVDMNEENIHIYPCLSYSNTGSFAVASCIKEVTVYNEKHYYDLLIQIDISDPNNYEIENVFNKEIRKDLLPSCASESKNKADELRKKMEDERKKRIIQYLKEGDNLYRQQKHFEAINKYKVILQLDPDNDVAQERIEACKRLITKNQIINNIEKNIAENNFEEALKKLNEIKNRPNDLSIDWIQNKINLCNKELKLQKYNELITTAQSYQNNHMYRLAKKYYQKARSLHINDNFIAKKIEECNSGDPNYIKHELNKAYKAAVKSKKNWLNTFKTYQKYERSGYLKGTNYYFMALMMLENKKVARAMGYSKSLAHSLSIKYFFKAKKLGCKECDLAFLENQVFTNSIYKH